MSSGSSPDDRGAAAPASALEAARALAPEIRARADAIEEARRLPADLAAALAEIGAFRLCVPRKLDGLESDVTTLLAVIEEVAQADASAGWCVMIGATTALVSGYLPESAAREIYGSDPRMITGGVFAPRGKAVREGAGYRVTGRWPWASGCHNCGWLMGGCVVLDDGKPRLLPSGAPDSRMMIFPAGEAVIHDTWQVTGLSGTGSNDIEVADLIVPEERSVSLITDRPRQPGPLYAFPVFGLLALGISAVAIGTARSAIDDLTALAGGKTPTGSRKPLAARPAVQAQVAQAEATLRSARAFLFDTVAETWAAAVAAGSITMAERALLRLAATHATASAVRVVDAMYEAAGGTSVYKASALQRRFRDVHVMTQHMMVAQPTWELTGRIFLGVDVDTSML